MNGMMKGVRVAGGRLAAAPTAVFVAVLTAGLGVSSTAHHLGLYSTNAVSARKCTVVLACPRTNAARSTAAGKRATSVTKTNQTSRTTAEHSSAASSAAAAAAGPQSGTNVSAEKNTSGKTGGSGVLSVPLPDFNAPELSRFISPL
jgi:hypothetical protein